MKKIEKVLLFIFLILFGIAVSGVLLLLYSDNKQEAKKEKSVDTEQEEWEKGLSDSTVWLPENCRLYEEIPDVAIADEAGENYQLSSFKGKKTVLVFWASWCEDCQKQMSYMKAYQELVNSYPNVQLILVNRTDGVKETKETAKEYYAKLDLQMPLFFDEKEQAYDSLGIHNIPTTFFLDEKGRIITWSPKQITETEVFDAYLRCLNSGNAMVTRDFIVNQLMDEAGGIHSQYSENRESAESRTVLSESQGLMMLYAVKKQDKALYDKVLQYTSSELMTDGLISWSKTEQQLSQVNALLDDLRIYHAMEGAGKLWDGYEEIQKEYRDRIKKYALQKNKYVDFYDAAHKQKASRLTLCYIDLQAMECLAKEDAYFAEAKSEAEQILINGQISDSFPLYYSWYNYQKKRYEDDDLNMAEAMLTLLHLAQEDQLPENTINWLKEQMSREGIKARMHTNGTVVSGYQYDSTAVYAIVALIGKEIEDTDLRDAALRKMEKMRIYNTGKSYNGAFGMENGTEIFSFDQLLPLIVYEEIEEAM